MINEKILKEHGYNKLDFKLTPDILQRHSDEMYQKLVRDGKTKKYFIDVYFYDGNFPQYEFEVYSHLPNGVATHTIFYGIHDLSLEQVEQMIDDFFTNSKMLPYEEDPDA